jgi:hypothetical protein
MIAAFIFLLLCRPLFGQERISLISLPDSALVVAYEKAAMKNVLAAVNPEVFFGYWSVCADGQGFGYGNTYPSLDGHQMSDALLWLGQTDVVKANWDYVRSFQRTDGLLPLAILPSMAGRQIGKDSAVATVATNGGLYEHWVPGNPLRTLAGTTYIQNADAIYRHTLDRQWLFDQLPSVNLAADDLASLTTDEGTIQGAGYYIERPARVESDGVAQCFAVETLKRLAGLNMISGDSVRADRYRRLAERIRQHFVTRFWAHDHFAEYLHPQRGLITTHGLTDVDWTAIATDVATAEQQAVLWPQLMDEERFHYGGMPTGISTQPGSYEDWEFTVSDRHDLAAMGRVWYVEAWARARMADARGLLEGIRKVIQVGRENGYSWHERYHPDGKGGVRAAGPDTYCEYPANLIRIVQRFLFGVDFRLEGSLVLAPTVTDEFWERGFGQTVTWRDRTLRYTMRRDRIEGEYAGNAPQQLGVRLSPDRGSVATLATIDGRSLPVEQREGLIFVTLPPKEGGKPCRFEIFRTRE